MEESQQSRPQRKRRRPAEQDELGGLERKKKKRAKHVNVSEDSFLCDNCPATSYLRGNPAVKKRRYFFDETTRKQLCLCNACGLKFKRKQNQKPPINKEVESKECVGKSEYLAAGVSFGQQVAELVEDEAALRFYCPKYRGGGGCGCLQAFLQGPAKEDREETSKRAALLLRYHRKAEELVQEEGRPGARSQEFEEFVLTNRDYLKSQLRLCEPAVQRILLYSNNFLYKTTLQGRGQRVEVQTAGSVQVAGVEGGQVLGQHSSSCGCGSGAGLEQGRVEEWRTQAVRGQAARRQVVREMWEKERGRLCPLLVQLVTGGGLSAIRRRIRELGRGGDL